MLTFRKDHMIFKISSDAENSDPTQQLSTLEENMELTAWTKMGEERRHFIGGSDARIIMGDDEAALAPALAGETRRGRAGGPVRQPDRPARHSSPRSSTGAGIERNTGQVVKDVQRRVSASRRKDGWRRLWTAWLRPGGAVFEAKFMLPWTFSEEAAAEKHMAQLQHNMWVVGMREPRCCRSSPAAANGSR